MPSSVRARPLFDSVVSGFDRLSASRRLSGSVDVVLDGNQSGSMESPPPPQLGVLAWAIALFGLTALGIVPLYAFVPDLSKFSVKLPPAQLAAVGLGVELTAFAPSLAAILVALLLPGAGGTRSLFRQVRRWRIQPIWYLIALLGPVPLLLTGTPNLGGPW